MKAPLFRRIHTVVEFVIKFGTIIGYNFFMLNLYP